MKVNGETVYYHGILPGRAPVPPEPKDDIDVDSIPLAKLKRDYLCLCAKSACVKRRACPCLDKCRYGQRYLELTGDGGKHGE